jgi:RNA polymerase subunit RPABC4/transcription elongation factor Spt4
MKTCPNCRQIYSDEIDSCPRDGSRLTAEFRDEWECPYCAERILRKARVCKHCGRDLESQHAAADAQHTQLQENIAVPKQFSGGHHSGGHRGARK